MNLTKKHILIIDTLLKTIEAEDRLAFNLNISTRTLANYLSQIQDYFQESVTLSRQHGRVELHIINEKLFNKLYEVLFQELKDGQEQETKLIYHIYLYLLSQEVNKIDDIADTFFISKSGANKLLSHLKSLLVPYNIRIEGVPNVGLKIQGNEFQIRKSLLEVFAEQIKGDIDEISQQLLECISYKYNLEETTKRRLFDAFVISEQRLRYGHSIAEKLNHNEEIYSAQFFEEFQKIKDRWIEMYHVTYPDDEVLLMVLQLIGRRATLLSFLNESDYYALLEDIIEKTIEDIEYYFSIKIDPEIFSFDIKQHLNYMINRLIFDIHIENTLINDIQQRYPFAYELSKVLAWNIEEKFDVDVPINELGFLSLYFSVYLAEIERRIREVRSIAVITDQGLSMTKLLVSNLRRIFGEQVLIDVFTVEELEKATLDNYKLKVSNVNLNKMFNEIVYIGNLLDTQQLKAKIERFLIYKDVKSRKFYSDSEIVNHTSNKDFTLLTKSEGNYQDLVIKMVDELIAEGKVEALFKERILSKEVQRSTEYKKLGFPHADYDGDEIYLKIGLIHDADIEDLKIIILLAIPNKVQNVAAIIRLYEEILAVGSNEYVLNKMNDIDNYVDFARLLNNEMRE
ncbi:BglG family transcription antiterminator [Staphylococcus americanisciuri]|uniref:PRD domain-containing protein n=1 Tax=Staphylococcus americanisciuri TaxID=2973940 RepID=A0ABT2F0B6_9STAP|nr:PRD domain-containing protein [Staphylococcus americanisciuri]MCS4485884.1 PRD domain-containing protein [Staphylococcus americanisciuri]